MRNILPAPSKLRNVRAPVAGYAIRSAGRGSPFVLGIASLLLGGCTDDLILSRKLSTVTGAPTGLVYGLPKGRVQVTAQRRLVTAEDVAKAKAVADSDEAGRVFRFESGHRSELKPASVPKESGRGGVSPRGVFRLA